MFAASSELASVMEFGFLPVMLAVQTRQEGIFSRQECKIRTMSTLTRIVMMTMMIGLRCVLAIDRQYEAQNTSETRRLLLLELKLYSLVH